MLRSYDDGSVILLKSEAMWVRRVLELSEELADQMEATPNIRSKNCEDRLLFCVQALRKRGVAPENLT